MPNWVACQSKPTRSCVLEEALRGDGAPLAGKDRLDVLIEADAVNHVEYATAADIEEARRQAKPDAIGLRYEILAIRGLVAANRKQQAADLVDSLRGPFQDLAFAELARTLAKAGDVDAAAAVLDRMGPTLDPSSGLCPPDRFRARWKISETQDNGEGGSGGQASSGPALGPKLPQQTALRSLAEQGAAQDAHKLRSHEDSSCLSTLKPPLTASCASSPSRA